jgi:hypothetical protein
MERKLSFEQRESRKEEPVDPDKPPPEPPEPPDILDAFENQRYISKLIQWSLEASKHERRRPHLVGGDVDLELGNKMPLFLPALPYQAIRATESSGVMVGAVGIEPSSPLQTRKLFILRSDKKYKNARNAEVRYTPGTRTS